MQVFHIIYNDYQVVKLSAAWLYIVILFGSFTTSRLQMEYHYCNLVSSWGSMEYLEFQIKETIGNVHYLWPTSNFYQSTSSYKQPKLPHILQGLY